MEVNLKEYFNIDKVVIFDKEKQNENSFFKEVLEPLGISSAGWASSNLKLKLFPVENKDNEVKVSDKVNDDKNTDDVEVKGKKKKKKKVKKGDDNNMKGGEKDSFMIGGVEVKKVEPNVTLTNQYINKSNVANDVNIDAGKVSFKHLVIKYDCKEYLPIYKDSLPVLYDIEVFKDANRFKFKRDMNMFMIKEFKNFKEFVNSLFDLCCSIFDEYYFILIRKEDVKVDLNGIRSMVNSYDIEKIAYDIADYAFLDYARKNLRLGQSKTIESQNIHTFSSWIEDVTHTFYTNISNYAATMYEIYDYSLHVVNRIKNEVSGLYSIERIDEKEVKELMVTRAPQKSMTIIRLVSMFTSFRVVVSKIALSIYADNLDFDKGVNLRISEHYANTPRGLENRRGLQNTFITGYVTTNVNNFYISLLKVMASPVETKFVITVGEGDYALDTHSFISILLFYGVFNEYVVDIDSTVNVILALGKFIMTQGGVAVNVNVSATNLTFYKLWVLPPSLVNLFKRLTDRVLKPNNNYSYQIPNSTYRKNHFNIFRVSHSTNLTNDYLITFLNNISLLGGKNFIPANKQFASWWMSCDASLKVAVNEMQYRFARIMFKVMKTFFIVSGMWVSPSVYQEDVDYKYFVYINGSDFLNAMSYTDTSEIDVVNYNITRLSVNFDKAEFWINRFISEHLFLTELRKIISAYLGVKDSFYKPKEIIAHLKDKFKGRCYLLDDFLDIYYDKRKSYDHLKFDNVISVLDKRYYKLLKVVREDVLGDPVKYGFSFDFYKGLAESHKVGGFEFYNARNAVGAVQSVTTTNLQYDFGLNDFTDQLNILVKNLGYVRFRLPTKLSWHLSDKIENQNDVIDIYKPYEIGDDFKLPKIDMYYCRVDGKNKLFSYTPTNPVRWFVMNNTIYKTNHMNDITYIYQNGTKVLRCIWKEPEFVEEKLLSSVEFIGHDKFVLKF